MCTKKWEKKNKVILKLFIFDWVLFSYWYTAQKKTILRNLQRNVCTIVILFEKFENGPKF